MSVERQEVICAQAWISQVYIEQSSHKAWSMCARQLLHRAAVVYWVSYYRKNNFFIRGSLQITIFKLLRFSALLLSHAIIFPFFLTKACKI